MTQVTVGENEGIESALRRQAPGLQGRSLPISSVCVTTRPLYKRKAQQRRRRRQG